MKEHTAKGQTSADSLSVTRSSSESGDSLIEKNLHHAVPDVKSEIEK